MEIMQEFLTALGEHRLHRDMPVVVRQRSKDGWQSRTIERIRVADNDGIETVFIEISES